MHEELKKLALAATPGLWVAGGASVTARETEDCPGLDAKLHGGNGQQKARNARYIAAANPAAIIALIEENEALRKDAGWQPIETAPQDGYMLVHEDSAIRALLRINGVWHKTSYPAIVLEPWGDVVVGENAKRLLPPGARLELRDGCCDNPTHWMPLPPPPVDAAISKEQA